MMDMIIDLKKWIPVPSGLNGGLRDLICNTTVKHIKQLLAAMIIRTFHRLHQVSVDLLANGGHDILDYTAIIKDCVGCDIHPKYYEDMYLESNTFHWKLDDRTFESGLKIRENIEISVSKPDEAEAAVVCIKIQYIPYIYVNFLEDVPELGQYITDVLASVTDIYTFIRQEVTAFAMNPPYNRIYYYDTYQIMGTSLARRETTREAGLMWVPVLELKLPPSHIMNYVGIGDNTRIKDLLSSEMDKRFGPERQTFILSPFKFQYKVKRLFNQSYSYAYDTIGYFEVEGWRMEDGGGVWS